MQTYYVRVTGYTFSVKKNFSYYIEVSNYNYIVHFVYKPYYIGVIFLYDTF